MDSILPKKFIGRQEEIDDLMALKAKKVASLVVIKGRRRIGKSRLITEFSKGFQQCKFIGLAPDKSTNATEQRHEFARLLSKQFHLPSIQADDWADLFDWLAKFTQSGSWIIVFDEITWMAQGDATFLAKLKNAWDESFSKNSNITLILCGSVSAWIEKNILSSTGYFGRVASQLTLEELSLKESSRLLQLLGFVGSTYEKLLIFSLTGGVPWYLELIDPSLSAIENIKKLCFRKNGILVNEYERIFHDLFGRRGAAYRKIVEVLAKGPQDYSNIAKMAGYPSGGPLSDYMEELVLSGFVRRDYSWSLKTGKIINISRYRLQDNYLRFYLKCIAPNLVKISKDLFKNMSMSAMPEWHSIIGLQFENLVLHNRTLILDQLRINPADIINEGPYLQKATKLKQGCQIDYLIQTNYNVLYLCEIKFSQSTIGMEIINDIEKKIAALDIKKTTCVKTVLIHASQVSNALLKRAFFSLLIDFTSSANLS